MARKPHLAYYAGTGFVPMPRAKSLTDLIRAAKRADVQYLFMSPVEAALRPEYAVLRDSGLALPGLRQLLYHVGRGGRKSALYAVGEPLADDTAQRMAVVDSLERHRATIGWEAEMAIAVELLHAREFERALIHLGAARALRPDEADIASLESNAFHALGRYDEAAMACIRSMKLGGATAAHHDQLGRIRFKQRRFEEASANFRRALEMEPGVRDRLYLLGLAEFEAGQYKAAAAAFREFLKDNPGAEDAARLAVLSLTRAGDQEGARRLSERAGLESGRGAPRPFGVPHSTQGDTASGTGNR